MERLAAYLIWTVVGLGVATALAQEGHPLTGTWSGDWGPGATQRTHITMVMTWDGKTVSGTINPGPDAIAVPAIALDVTNWTIRFEADSQRRVRPGPHHGGRPAGRHRLVASDDHRHMAARHGEGRLQTHARLMP